SSSSSSTLSTVSATQIFPLSLHDALPISPTGNPHRRARNRPRQETRTALHAVRTEPMRRSVREEQEASALSASSWSWIVLLSFCAAYTSSVAGVTERAMSTTAARTQGGDRTITAHTCSIGHLDIDRPVNENRTVISDDDATMGLSHGGPR